MNRPMYCQKRRGQFTASVVPRGQCGFAAGQHTFTYDVEVCTTQLDGNGFIIDNRDLDRLFDKWTKGEWHASCEDLAGGGVCAVLDVIGDRAEVVKCTVSPNAYADLECKWTRGMERPVHCPVAVHVNGHSRQHATTVTK